MEGTKHKERGLGMVKYAERGNRCGREAGPDAPQKGGESSRERCRGGLSCWGDCELLRADGM
jgi:hypothetical protein